ncbi:MAG: hypothetical protein QOF37_1573 [Thermoleophilaceae bacterium]|nr:hypothetical protein [Thermoleophilaceae bacterium]
MGSRIWPVVVLAGLGLLLPASASATTWQVTSTGDSGGSCPDPTSCTLRAAVTDANAGAGGDVVQVPAGHITLSVSPIAITKAMTIVGTAGPASTTVEQLSTTVGIFSISAAATGVTVSGLTLTGGHEPNGGAIASQAPALTLANDVFSSNAPGVAGATGSGGAVRVSGSATTALTVTNSSFSSNRAGGDGGAADDTGVGFGGAISFETPGTLAVADSVFSGNRAGGSGGGGHSSGQGDGGAISATTTSPTGSIDVTVTRSVFSADRAGGPGAAGTFSGNGHGGAIELVGGAGGASLSVTESTFSGNLAGGTGGSGFATGVGFGGAIGAFDGNGSRLTVDLVGSTFSANQAGGDGGTNNDGGQAVGGGVAFGPDTAGSAMTATNSTFDGNRAGGTAGTGMGSGVGLGGSIATQAAASLSLVNDTLAGGVAGGADGSGGNLNPAFAGGPATLKNTTLSGGIADTGSNCARPITSLGHNIETANDCGLTGSGDRPSTDPSLGALASNGGLTQTRAPLAGSPAIDGGDSSGCPATDQRGVLRPAGASCDAGAFEVATPGATTGAASSIHAVSATLNGLAFNPDLGPGTASFQYGTTTTYGGTSPSAPLAALTRQTALSAVLHGLAPNTTYHFRAVASNVLGTVMGLDQTFTTTGGATISRLKLSPSSIVPAPGHGASAARAKKKKRTGATLSFLASDQGVTRFTVQRSSRGYRSGHRCVTRKPHGKAKPRRCTLYRSVGSFNSTTSAGSHHLHFTGRVRNRPLAVGRYRLQALETDLDGHKGKPANRSFRIVR